MHLHGKIGHIDQPRSLPHSKDENRPHVPAVSGKRVVVKPEDNPDIKEKSLR